MSSESANQTKASCSNLSDNEGKKRERVGLYKHLGTISFATIVYLGKDASELTCLEKAVILCMVISTVLSIFAVLISVANYSEGKNLPDEHRRLKYSTYGLLGTFLAGLSLLVISIIF